MQSDKGAIVFFVLREGSRPCYQSSDAGACGHVCAQSGLGCIQPNTVPVHAGSDMPAGHCCNRSDLHRFGERATLSQRLHQENARCHHLGIQTDELKAKRSLTYRNHSALERIQHCGSRTDRWKKNICAGSARFTHRLHGDPNPTHFRVWTGPICLHRQMFWQQKNHARLHATMQWRQTLATPFGNHSGGVLAVRALYVHHLHTRKDPRIRAPLKQADCEDAVMMSQLLLSAYYEANEQHPLACQKEDILKPFLDGNTNLELDLQGAVSECRKNWQPADLACFKAAIAESLAKRDGKMTQLGHGPKITPGQLEKQTFELNMTSMQLDVDSYIAFGATNARTETQRCIFRGCSTAQPDTVGQEKLQKAFLTMNVALRGWWTCRFGTKIQMPHTCKWWRTQWLTSDASTN